MLPTEPRSQNKSINSNQLFLIICKEIFSVLET